MVELRLFIRLLHPTRWQVELRGFQSGRTNGAFDVAFLKNQRFSSRTSIRGTSISYLHRSLLFVTASRGTVAKDRYFAFSDFHVQCIYLFAFIALLPSIHPPSMKKYQLVQTRDTPGWRTCSICFDRFDSVLELIYRPTNDRSSSVRGRLG